MSLDKIQDQIFDELKSGFKEIETRQTKALGRLHSEVVKDVVFQSQLAEKVGPWLDSICSLNSWSICPELALLILQCIEDLEPELIVEFGSGVSTLIIADGLRRRGTPGKLLSIEHNEKYYEQTRSLITSNDLEEFVQLELCPISTVTINESEHRWYSQVVPKLTKFLAGGQVDFLLIDGPPAATQKFARYPALPVIKQYLSLDALVILDDGAREDEEEIVRRWLSEAGGSLQVEFLTHIRRCPALLFAGKSPRLKMLKEDSQKVPTINQESIVAPMVDYVNELVKRGLLRFEVAEGLALKHQLLLQAENFRCTLQIQDIERLQAKTTAELKSAKICVDEIQANNQALNDQVAYWKERAATSQQAIESAERSFEQERQEFKAEKKSQQDRFEEVQRNLAAAISENCGLLEERRHLQDESANVANVLDLLRQERDRLREEFALIQAEVSALQHEKSALIAANEACVRNADEQAKTMIARVKQLSGHIEELNSKNAASKARAASMKQLSESSANMNREVYAFVDTLQRDYLRVQNEANQLRSRLDRTKNHLSYRLGSVLVENSSSLRGIFSIPAKLRAQKKQFYAYRQLAQNSSTDKNAANLILNEGISYSFARTRWRNVELDIAGRGGVIELSVLTPSGDKSVSLEIHALPGAGDVALVGSDGKEKRIVGISPVELHMSSGGSSRSIEFGANASPVVIGIRKTAGGAAIVKLCVTASHMVAGADYRHKPESIGSAALPQAISVQVGQTPLALSSSPKPMKSSIIWQASQMMDQGRIEEGIAFAKENAREFIRPAINLLMANRAITDEKLWLESVNEYFRQFNISPLALTSGNDARFLRLHSESNERYEAGPLISVIMPAFNSCNTIAHSINSILNQTWRNIELVVVDDASDDSTWSIVQGLAARDKRMKIFRNARNVGPYVSKNLALQFCKGQYITGHDADDWAHPDRLARQVGDLLRSDGQLKGNMARMIRMMENGKFVHFAKEGKTSDDGVLRDAAISCMFELEFFKKHLGYWDCVRFGADSELISRAQKVMQDRFVKVRHMTMICLDNEGSLTNDPIHGVSKVTGISPTRKFYRDQWTAWHANVDPLDAVLPFPYATDRKFAVPEAAAVLVDDILENMRLASQLVE